MEVNILAFIATALFILVPTLFTYYLCKNSQPK
uniref:Photosystem II protein M n=1 Tax=Fargesia denudata TaxID=1306438 RepID=A0A1W6GX07_9POAL|nr:photosystem II protein M [Fargesia denudata]ARM20343.1 photosystem II protein M [Fargesia denudata]